MNFIRGAIDDRYFVTETLRLEIPEDKLAELNAQGYQRKAVVFGIRPEDILTLQSSGEDITAKVSVAELTYAEFMLYATVGGMNWLSVQVQRMTTSPEIILASSSI